MKKVVLKAVVSVLLSAVAGSVSAHDILGGALGAGTSNPVDVFRTTCFSWGDGVHPAAPAGEVSGAARGFRAAISYTGGDAVQANIGFTSAGNVNGNLAGNNVLPASPAPNSITVSDSSIGSAWNVNAAAPDFSSTGRSPAPFGTSRFLDNGAGAGNGDYVIVVSQISPAGNSSSYDFFGHCQNASSGVPSTIHTGQGNWFTGTAPNVVPNFDFDQVIDQ